MIKFLLILFLFTSCVSHTGHYTNKEGRVKQKHYEAVQYGNQSSISNTGKKLDKMMEKKRKKNKKK